MLFKRTEKNNLFHLPILGDPKMFSLYCKYNIYGPDVLILHTRVCLESLHHAVTPKIKETKEKLGPKIS